MEEMIDVSGNSIGFRNLVLYEADLYIPSSSIPISSTIKTPSVSLLNCLQPIKPSDFTKLILYLLLRVTPTRKPPIPIMLFSPSTFFVVISTVVAVVSGHGQITSPTRRGVCQTEAN